LWVTLAVKRELLELVLMWLVVLAAAIQPMPDWTCCMTRPTAVLKAAGVMDTKDPALGPAPLPFCPGMRKAALLLD
jgi:hypothetical protein